VNAIRPINSATSTPADDVKKFYVRERLRVAKNVNKTLDCGTRRVRSNGHVAKSSRNRVMGSVTGVEKGGPRGPAPPPPPNGRAKKNFFVKIEGLLS